VFVWRSLVAHVLFPIRKLTHSWVNNQRSAKAKGSLKEDRERRLLDAGLRWSVSSTKSAWDDMLAELRIYVAEKAEARVKWNGNVPSSYQIKKRPNDKGGEDKLLGRWVNRQRSLYHSGKLRKDRQLALEKVGLKWSMQVSNSWDTMFEALKVYIDDCKANKGGKWDGNVVATYKTDDDPPLSLGRWVNRVRSAHARNTLKKEQFERLNALGLKWSVYNRDDEKIGGDENGKSGDASSGKENADEEPAKPKESPVLSEEPVETPKEPKTEAVIGETAII